LSFSIPKGNYQLTCYTSQQPDQDVYYVNFQTV
ncbi:DNA-entry nuclease, partial [Listeria monocytogenes]|nr:DNA-entry nuclease [Listeria monocytogenes]